MKKYIIILSVLVLAGCSREMVPGTSFEGRVETVKASISATKVEISDAGKFSWTFLILSQDGSWTKARGTGMPLQLPLLFLPARDLALARILLLARARPLARILLLARTSLFLRGRLSMTRLCHPVKAGKSL